ncbi:hypothetical protein [Leptolyngbya sp. NIES-2104]|uniref:hypothetical protein n=1 Tax=Leptolyngbya sp. NIES-2104 TaxID=1552121 RepID=UPI0006EC9503|nr:hypothetical protein [Leptolyngbya sp. NIES-2104]GAP98773.1 hypothetical protein NIES2104_53290 [Leptolyngbya sp. NIES-2104]
MNRSTIAASALVLGLGMVPMASLSALATPIQISQAIKQPLPPTSAPVKTPAPVLQFGLQDGAPLKLKFKRTISSKDSNLGEVVDFEVAEDVLVGNRVVIAKGAPAKGKVTKVRGAGMLGRKGKLEIAVEEVTLVTGERVAIRGSQQAGGGHAGGIIAVAAVINPLALLFKGKQAVYEAGTEVPAFVDGNFALNQARFKAIKK